MNKLKDGKLLFKILLVVIGMSSVIIDTVVSKSTETSTTSLSLMGILITWVGILDWNTDYGGILWEFININNLSLLEKT